MNLRYPEIERDVIEKDVTKVLAIFSRLGIISWSGVIILFYIKKENQLMRIILS